MDHATPAIALFILIFAAILILFIRQAQKGKKFFVRRIAGIDAIDETIGRAVELGRPLSFTSGLTGVTPLLYACLGVLRYVAEKAAMYTSRLFVPCSDPEALVLTDATLQNAYRAQNKFSSYDPSSLRFLSDEQFAFASGYMGLVHRENVAGAFLFGKFAAESLILAEAGQQIGAVQVAGTISAEQVPFFLVACDYTLIGEELYAAGAYLSNDPVQIGSLKAQDYAKLGVLIVVILGIAHATYLSVTGTEGLVFINHLIDAPWSALFGGGESQ